ncbi:MAG: heme o synthase, partial [Nitrososphaerales archaeon]
MGIREYAEISKFRIVAVLNLVAITSLLAASKWQVSWETIFFLFIAGTLASIGSSALNHYYDRDVDSLMSRTSKRPIPSGRLSARNAFVYGITLSIGSIFIAYLTLNPIAAAFIALGIFFYVIIYTAWLKRINASNIVIGGFAGSCASYAGWVAGIGTLDLLGFLVGLLVFIWTPSHFWCLAIKSKEEYASARIPMLPVLVGDSAASKYVLANTLVLVPYSIMLYFFGLGLLYLIIASLSGAMMLAYNFKLIKNPNKDVAWKAYKVSSPYLAIIFLALMF